VLALQCLYHLCLRGSLLRYLFLLALFLHKSACCYVELLVLVSKLSLQLFHLSLNTFDLLFLFTDLAPKLGYLIIEISLQVSNLGLRLLRFDIEGINLSVALNDLLLQVADLFLILLPYITDFL
jgi:hypothetical protein